MRKFLGPWSEMYFITNLPLAPKLAVRFLSYNFICTPYFPLCTLCSTNLINLDLFILTYDGEHKLQPSSLCKMTFKLCSTCNRYMHTLTKWSSSFKLFITHYFNIIILLLIIITIKWNTIRWDYSVYQTVHTDCKKMIAKSLHLEWREPCM